MPVVALDAQRKKETLDNGDEARPEQASDEAEDDVIKQEDEDDVKVKNNQRQERTFISFSDEATMKASFPSRGIRLPAAKICPITRLPAKYFDPVTELPYANLQVG
jgi:vacuolar protein sorting-associated protein 72